MSKNKSKEWGFIIIVILGIAVLPIALNIYFKNAERNTFYEYVKEDYETCVKRAKEDSRDDKWCSEIRNSSKLAFQSATSASDNFMLILPLQVILLIVFFGLRDIAKKLDSSE